MVFSHLLMIIYISAVLLVVQIFFMIFKPFFNPIQDGLFRSCSRMGQGPKRSPLSKICHTYPTMMKLGTVITYLKKFQKLYESPAKPFEFSWHQHFVTGNKQILLYQEIQIYIQFRYIISNYSNFYLVFKDCFNKDGQNFDDVSKNGYPKPF